jgi:hypothetical protein
MSPRRFLAPSVLVAILVMAIGSPALAQVGNASQPKPHQAQNTQKGFLDYALGKINPDQKDYGSQVELIRRVAVEETIDKAYFWSNVVSLFLLASVTTLYLLTLRSGDKKELIAATLIAELWNGLVSSREEIERIEKDNRTIVSRSKEVEQSLQTASSAKPADGRGDTRTQRKVDRLIDGPKLAAVDSENNSQVDPGKSGRTVKPPEVAGLTDLQQRNVLLERQIEAMRNTEQNLKERLNQTTSLLDQERKRNRTLKGA